MPSARPEIALVWINDYHAGDPLFIQSVARALAARTPETCRAVLVHGGAERAERLLEAQALPFEFEDGVPVSDSPRVRAVVERAYRESNKDIVSVMTELGVPAVGIQGADRSLLTVADGTLKARRVGWLETLAAAGPVVVLSALADSLGVVSAVATGRAVHALARALTIFEPEVRIFHGDRREMARTSESERLDRLAATMPDADHDAVRSLLEEHFRVVLCDSRTVFDPNPATRTPIFG